MVEVDAFAFLLLLALSSECVRWYTLPDTSSYSLRKSPSDSKRNEYPIYALLLLANQMTLRIPGFG